MNDEEIDEIYTAICHRMTATGEQHALLYLGRLVLLLAYDIADPAAVHRAISTAEIPAGRESSAHRRPVPPPDG